MPAVRKPAGLFFGAGKMTPKWIALFLALGLSSVLRPARTTASFVLALVLVGMLYDCHAAAVPLDCTTEVFLWCKGYPMPHDINCERFAADECRLLPPSRAELCELRGKRLCEGVPSEDYLTCVDEKAGRCK